MCPLPAGELMASTPQLSVDWRTLLIGASPAILEVFELIRLVAGRRSTVLIMGETGTGKEVVARAIHMASPRARQPFVAVNCAAIPKDLLEAELFGHVRGAFTGATNARAGRFEQAHSGTLLLDEIGDMPLDLQAKLLRALQEREFQRVGSSETVQVDVRVLAATNINLLARVRQGKFREDLYYRLHVVPLRVPPVRERKEDIPLLVDHFIKKVSAHEKIPPKTVPDGTLRHLMLYSWPGNVRQLENALEMAMVLSADRAELAPSDFPFPKGIGDSLVEITPEQLVKLPEGGLDFEAVIGRIELDLLDQALRRVNGNKKLAADMLCLKRTTLAAKLKSFAYALAEDQQADE
jgi:transcriptional regulator with GAF, ATPase, and Fis domain